MKKIPYGRQFIDLNDQVAVRKTLQSDFITTGNKVIEFEKFHTYRIPYKEFEIDIAEAREETYESLSRKPNKVTSATISEDLGRRDFTVNAIALSLNKENLGEFASNVILFEECHGIHCSSFHSDYGCSR